MFFFFKLLNFFCPGNNYCEIYCLTNVLSQLSKLKKNLLQYLLNYFNVSSSFSLATTDSSKLISNAVVV